MLSANVFEQRVLPVIAAFAAGVVIAQWRQDAYVGELLAQEHARVDLAHHTARNAQRVADLYASACGPLLSWPVESTPELIAAERTEEAAR